MHKKLIIFFILIFSLVSRFWQIGELPPLIDSSVINSRFISAFLNISNVMLVFLLVRNKFKKEKLALLSAWVMAVMPWTIEQGRIVSPVNNALFFCLIILLFLQKVKRLYFRLFLLLLIPLGIYFTYPDFWIFRDNHNLLSINNLLTNLFILLSPDFLFFRNITFWWGGIREFGIVYISFLPFILTGIYWVIIERKLGILILLAFILVISALSPFFPESREFFLSVPLISLVTGFGIYKLSLSKRRPIKLLLAVLLLLFSYEIAQYFHYYTVHYRQEIITNQSQIHEAF